MGMAIKNPNLIGIDRTKPMQLQVFLQEIDQNSQNIAPNKLIPSISLNIPTTKDGPQYIDILKQSGGATETKDGIMIIESPTGSSLYVKIANGYASISDNEKAVKESVPVSSAPLLNVKGTLRIGITPKSFIPYIKFGANQTESAMATQPAIPGMDMNPAKVISAEANILNIILEQIEGIALGIKINNNTIDINSKLNPTAGSTIAKINESAKTPSSKLTSLAPANALYAVSGSGMDSIDLILEPYSKLIEEIYGAMGPQFSDLAPILSEMMQNYKGLYSGEFAMGVVPTTTGLGFYEAFALADTTKAKKIMTDSISTYNSTMNKAMPGITLNTETNRTYKKVSIQAISYNIDQAAMNLPVPTTDMDWVNNMKFEIAYIDNNMLASFGGPEVMNKLIDRINSKKTIKYPTAEFTKLIPELKQTPVESYTLSLTKLIKALLLMSPDITETMLAGISDTDGIAGYTITKGKDTTSLTRISMTEIIAIKNMIPIIQSTVSSQVQMQMPVTPTPVTTPQE
jgi:hypothetical protein